MTDRPPMLIQFFTLRPVAAVNDVRIHQPAAALAQLPGVRCHVLTTGGSLARPQMGEASIFVWQRQILTPDSCREHLALTRAGHVVVSEWDDDPRIWPKVVETDFFCLRTSHAIQTSTKPLGDFIRPHNPNVGVFPNQLPDLPPAPRPAPDGTPVTIFFGALNREDDWAPVMPVLNDVLDRYPPGRVRVQVVHDRAFFDAVNCADKTFEPICDHTRYRALLRGADIALLPLEDSDKNRLKSDLKFIECAAEGTVALASPVVYADSIRNNETGLIFRSPEQFGLRLRALIGDRALRTRLAATAWQQVASKRQLRDHVGGRLDWYHALWQRRAELQAAMQARCLDIPATHW